MTISLPSNNTLSLLTVIVGALAMPELGFAQATVTWTSAQDTADASDIAAGGAIIEARNGLVFASYLSSNPTCDITTGGVAFSGTNFLGAQFPNEPPGSFVSNHTSGDPDYDTLIGNVSSCDGTTLGNGSTNESANYQVSGLTVGEDYLMQIWYTDVRNISNAREVTIDGAVTLFSGLSSDMADLGQFTVGRFTAAATTQLVNIDTNGTSGRAGISGIMVRVDNGGGLGASYCGPAVVNSSGAPASIIAAGSAVAMDNDVTLTNTGMPANAFGFFIVSQTQGFTANPGGSEGNLCLGGAIGRYVGPGQIQNSGPAGMISLVLDLTDVPQPLGSVAVASGETWNFQMWFRDTSAAGTPTSNFSNGVQIDFQ